MRILLRPSGPVTAIDLPADGSRIAAGFGTELSGLPENNR